MKKIKKVYIVGLGAIGSAYASIMRDSEPDLVKVIADSERIKKYEQKGVIINEQPYYFDFVTPEQSTEKADLIIISVKFHQLDQAIKDIKNFVAEDTIILSLLNGISSEEIIGEEYGMDTLLYSFSVGIDAVREDTSVTFSTPGQIVFGEKTNFDLSPKAAAVKDLFDRTGVPYTIPEDMIRELWFKFMLNVGINQTSAVVRASYGQVIDSYEACQLVRAASSEVVDIASELGINLTEADVDETFRIYKTLSPEGKTSMLQDVEAGRKTEVEIFGGEVIKLGEKLGISTAVNKTLYNIIRATEKMYLA